MGVSDKDFAAMRSRAASMDLRRQKQIDNQIASINRLLKDGTYDSEMELLHRDLALTQAAHAELKDAISSELRGLADSLDDSVISNEDQRLVVYNALIKLRDDLQAMPDGS